ncbi:MAG TPA: hypothetical protein VEK56_09320 [Vicinamibacterales bacterium]|nr:hypothetical protein [Vicinamibacterales bacterium]
MFHPVRHSLLRLVALVSLCASAACVESTFELAPEARLPRWFSVPSGLSRADLRVVSYNYVGPAGRTTLWVVKGKDGRKVAEVTAKLRGLEPLTMPDQPNVGFEIMTAGGVTEVIEYRRIADDVLYKPFVWVVDDPEIKRRLGVNE